MVGGEGQRNMGATGHRERCGERDQQGAGDTQRQRHEGWMQRWVWRWKEPRHGKRDKETDKSVGRETQSPRDIGRRPRETVSVIDTETFT